MYEVRRSWPDLGIEVETTVLHGLLGGLAIHLLIHPDLGFAQEASRMIEAGTNRLRPWARTTSGCASSAGTT